MGVTEDLDLCRRLSAPAERGAAAAELVCAYGSRLHVRLVQLVGPDDADDLFQNTLMKVMQHASTFGGKASLYSWCHRIASNEALDHLRKRRRHAAWTSPLDSVDYAPTSGSELPGAAWIEALLLEAIGSLPPKQRSVFEARYYRETPYAELSVELGTSVGALKASYHHAVKKVAEHLRLSPILIAA